MKKFLLSICMLTSLSFGISHAEDGVVFYEDFENDEYQDFSSTEIGDWITLDRDRQECWGFLNTTFLVKPEVNSSPVLNSFLVFNTDQYVVSDPTGYVADYSAHSGKKAMLANSILVVDTNADDWLISPKIELKNDNYIINFWAKEANGINSNITFKVLITDQDINSANDFNADDFEVVNNGTISLSSYLNAGSYGNWLQFAFQIDEKYRNKTVRIAINHLTSGSSGTQYFMIDDFRVITSGCLATAENIKVSDILDKEATISWEGNGDKYEVEYGKAGFKRGSSEQATVKYTEDTQIVLSELEPYTNYEVFVTAYCSDEEESLIGGKKTSFKTDIYVNPVVITEDEGYEFGFEVKDLYLEGWRIENNSGAGYWKSAESSSQGIGSFEGNRFMVLDNYNGVEWIEDENGEEHQIIIPADTWLFSRGFYLEEGQEVIISFWTWSPDESDNLEVTISDGFRIESHIKPEAETVLKKEGLNNKEYVKHSVTYTSKRNGAHYLGFHCYSPHFWSSLHLDYVVIEDVRSMVEEEYEEILYDDYEKYKDFAFAQVGNWILINNGNKEKIFVEDVEFSNNGSSASFMVFNENAVSGNIEEYSFSAHSGDKAMISFSTKEGRNDDWLISEKVSLGASQNVVSFWAKAASMENPREIFDVLVSAEDINADNFDPSKFESILSEPINMEEYVDAEAGTKWIKFAYSLDDYKNKDIHVAINCISGNNSCALLIDDIKVSKGAYIGTIQDVGIWESFSGVAELYWKSDMASQYEVQYGKKGFEVETGTSKFVSSRIVEIDNLEENSEYEFYIRPYSVGGQESELWSGPYYLITEPDIVDINKVYSYGFEDISFKREGWRAENGWSQVTGDETGAYEGDSYIAFRNNSQEAYDYYFLYMRPFNFYPNHEYIISFAYRTTTLQENLTIALGYKFTGVGETSVYPLWAIDNVSNLEYEIAETKVTVRNADSMYLTFTCYSEVDGEEIEVFIDNVVITDKDLTGIENSDVDNLQLHIYPNPTTDVLNIQLPESFNKDASKIVVTDMTGRVVKQAAYVEVFSVSDLNAGAYNITIVDANNRVNKFFIKK